MARVVEQKEMLVEWDDVVKLHRHLIPPVSLRSGGVHVTDILRYLHFGSEPAADQAEKQKEWDLEDQDVMPLKMCLGMAWEQWAVGLYPEIEWQPGEVEMAGIAGSPDGYSVLEIAGQSHVVIEEFKLTWKSYRYRDLLKERLWMWQIKAYVWMAGMEAAGGEGYARMHVCWVNGDYQHPYTPRYYRYLIEFEEEELDRNWVMVRENRDRAVEWNGARGRT
jgi:hypothetical protein